jgi:hypothetical protein
VFAVLLGLTLDLGILDLCPQTLAFLSGTDTGAEPLIQSSKLLLWRQGCSKVLTFQGFLAPEVQPVAEAAAIV